MPPSKHFVTDMSALPGELWRGAPVMDRLQVLAAAPRNEPPRVLIDGAREAAASFPADLGSSELCVLRAILVAFVCRLASRWSLASDTFVSSLGDLAGASTERLAECFVETLGRLRDRTADSPAIDQRIAMVLASLRRLPSVRSVSLDDLARSVELSRWHLQRLLRTQTGKSLTAHVRQIRVERAAEYLEGSLLTIKEIAALTGYPHQSCFCRDFRRAFGCSAGSWRKSQKRSSYLRSRNSVS